MANNNIVPTVVLSDNHSMPVMGLGTGDMATFGEVVKNANIEGIKAGYRHLDTASSYGTEQDLGDAIEEALKLGLIGSRDELFITSKLWFTDAHPDRVIPALKKSLGLLKLEYLDLYLIHLPVSAKPSDKLFPPKEDITPLDVKGVWAAMEECKRLGLTKSIGVSNFPVRTLESLLSVATIPPCVNQVRPLIFNLKGKIEKTHTHTHIFGEEDLIGKSLLLFFHVLHLFFHVVQAKVIFSKYVC